VVLRRDGVPATGSPWWVDSLNGVTTPFTKSGFVAWGVSRSGAGSTRLAEPRRYRSYFGGMGAAPRRLATVFVAREALEDARARRALPADVSYAPVSGARGLTRADMLRNTAVPTVRVPRDGSPVLVNGTPTGIPAAQSLPLTQLHQFA